MEKDIIKDALDQFRESWEGGSYNRDRYEEDIRFARLGDQWPDAIRKLRQEEGRPALTINRLPSFIRQVVNDARQNKPAVTVHPVDSGADVDKAKVIAGIVRSIERQSNADIAYDTAIDCAVSGGFGFFRIDLDYASPDSFDMELFIRRVANPLMVYWDVSSTEFDASDWRYAFVSDLMTESEFEQAYPGAEKIDFEGGTDTELIGDWILGERVRVAEYWAKSTQKRKLILARNAGGEFALREDMLEKVAKEFIDGTEFDMGKVGPDELVRAYFTLTGTEIVKEREAEFPEVKRYMISGKEVLEESVWPGGNIPICPVWGEEVIVDGRRHFRSMIQDARDPATMLNYWRSATTELVALAPRAPWIGPEGFIPPGQEQKWETANTRSHAYLTYSPDTGAAPQRVPFAGVPAGALQEALSAQDDMKAIIGIYDSSLGARSNETSGRAILARQREADSSNFHFIDNLNRAIRYCGQCLVDLIPHVYHGRQMVRILGEDMKEEVVSLVSNQAQPQEDGSTPAYDLTIGRYDVTVKSGPSYATQREEARDILIEIMRQIPDAAPLIGDIVLEHLDFVGAERVAERLKLLLPPQVQAAEGIQAPMVPGMAAGGVPPRATAPGSAAPAASPPFGAVRPNGGGISPI